MDGVFINYRRDDSSGWANRLHRDLIDRFGAERVFRDLNLEPGINFKEAITEHLRRCKVQLVLIGRQWLTITDSKGRVRIQKADDLVRAEIAIALANNVRVIPVLVQDAEMPAADELGEDIRGLAERNAVELSDKRWDHDTKELFDVIARILGVPESERAPEKPAHISPEPSPATPGTASPAAVRSRRSFGIALWWFITALLFIGFIYLSLGICLILYSPAEQGRGMLALFGICWGLASWLPVARIVGLKGQSAHTFLAALSWTLAWSLIWPSAMFINPDPENRSLGSLAKLLVADAPHNSQFHARLLAVAIVGSSGSLVAVYLRLLWNKKLQRELLLLPVLWSVVLYLSFVVVVEVLSGETRSEYLDDDLIAAFTITLVVGSCLAAGFIGYWDRGNSFIRAIRSIPQSQDPRIPTKPEHDTTNVV